MDEERSNGVLSKNVSERTKKIYGNPEQYHLLGCDPMWSGNVHRCFCRIYFLYLQCRRVSHASRIITCRSFLFGLLFDLHDGRHLATSLSFY
jgi:hypothetical protein